MRLIGGSGGHFSPSYFDKYLKIPIFSYDKQKEIARLYHNPEYEPIPTSTKDNLLEWHKNHNRQLGIFELDKELKTIKNELNQIQDRIIKGNKVLL
jgi:hypothetical protein